jgi:hypothetical protein
MVRHYFPGSGQISSAGGRQSEAARDETSVSPSSTDELVAMVRDFQRERNELKRKLETAEAELFTAKKYKDSFEAERAEWVSELTPLTEEANRLWSVNVNYRTALLQLNWQPPPLLHSGIPAEQLPPEDYGNQRLKKRYRQLQEYIQYLQGDNQNLENMLRQAFGLTNDLSLAQYIMRLRDAVANQPPPQQTQTVSAIPAPVPASVQQTSNSPGSSASFSSSSCSSSAANANTAAVTPTKESQSNTANAETVPTTEDSPITQGSAQETDKTPVQDE